MSTMEQVKPSPVRAAEPGEGMKGWWGRSRAFITESRNEMRRVTWPSRREVWATTIVVILVSAFFGVYLWSLDMLFSRIVDWVFRTFGAA